MTDHVQGKVVVITGAAGGFGRLLASKLAGRGAAVVLGDVDEEGLHAAVEEIRSAGGRADGLVTDVTDREQVVALADLAADLHGRVDVMVNNAGIMPLAFHADHRRAAAAWDRCIDVNLKGVLHGIMAVHDRMIEQGRGHVVNLSSIYGNHPVAGAGVYGATKAAVVFLSESLRLESQGRIKVTTVRPTGVPGTALGTGVVNPAAIAGILGGDAAGFVEQMGAMAQGTLPAELTDPEEIGYVALAPELLVDAIVGAIDQPWGVSISDVTVRASGDRYVL